MKLDRNVNKDGRGKYALLNIRKQTEFENDRSIDNDTKAKVYNSLICLINAGLLSYGNESPDEQFFVLKYKDKFAAPALLAYSEAVLNHIRSLFNPTISAKILNAEPLTDEEQKLREKTALEIRQLNPYWSDVSEEALKAAHLGKRIPD